MYLLAGPSKQSNLKFSSNYERDSAHAFYKELRIHLINKRILFNQSWPL